MSTRAFLDAYLSVTTLRPRNLYLAAFDALAAALDAATDTAQIGGHTFAALEEAPPEWLDRYAKSSITRDTAEAAEPRKTGKRSFIADLRT